MSANPVVKLADLRLDGGTQSRAALDEETIAEYAAAYAVGSGAKMPPPVVFHDGAAYWLGDGFHRVLAAQRAACTQLECAVRNGSRRDAWLYSLGANAQHGLRRSRADKRRAVLAALADDELKSASDRDIAKLCAVSQPFVSELRKGDTIKGETPVQLRPAGERSSAAVHVRRDAPAILDAGGGDERAGGSVGGASTPSSNEPPALDEPDNVITPPAVDMLGLLADEEWHDSTSAAAGLVKGIDSELRRLQSIARGIPQPHGARLYAALHDAAALARALLPEVACPMCKDPDGTKGKRKGCLSCNGLGWMTAEGRKGLHPSALAAAAANPVMSKSVQRRLAIQLQTPAGEVPFDDVPDPTDDDAF